jgi:hypothetical protein
MFELKTISKQAIPRSIEKAEHYRLLNEPEQAESICLDILQVEPENQQALIILLLALTDQFDKRMPESRPRELLTRLQGDYERAYYAGIICERKGRAQFALGVPGAHYAAYDWLREAMNWYEKAEALRPPQNDDATLRWNACVRMIMEHRLVARPADNFRPLLE